MGGDHLTSSALGMRPALQWSLYWQHFPGLLVQSHQLACFSLVIAKISPRYIINPERVRIIEVTDQDAAIKIRYPGDITSILTVPEPGRIVIRKLDINRLQSAFLWIVCCNFHALCVLSSALSFFHDALFQSIAIPIAIDDMRFVGYPIQ